MIQKAIIPILFLAAFSLLTGYSQEKEKKVETIEFKVEGVCGMCKERIENAALIKGVKYTEWNKEKQQITVVYKPKVITEEGIHKAIAEKGHDTPKAKATKESYKNLPACCAYRDGVKQH